MKTYGTMYYVSDMNKAVSFYRGILGIQPAHESNEWTEFACSGHSLCLHGKRAGETYQVNGILVFNVEQVKSLFEKMKSDGINAFALHEVHPQAWVFHVKDSDGNETSFYGTP